MATNGAYKKSIQIPGAKLETMKKNLFLEETYCSQIVKSKL
jgi:hypothetical protein